MLVDGRIWIRTNISGSECNVSKKHKTRSQKTNKPLETRNYKFLLYSSGIQRLRMKKFKKGNLKGVANEKGWGWGGGGGGGELA